MNKTNPNQQDHVFLVYAQAKDNLIPIKTSFVVFTDMEQAYEYAKSMNKGGYLQWGTYYVMTLEVRR